MPSRSVGHALVVFGLVSLGALAVGCDNTPKCGQGASEACASTKAGSFESDLPAGSLGSSDESDGAELGSPTGGVASGSAAPPNASPGAQQAGRPADSAGADANRAIVEADMIQLAGDRLYALSRIAGLAVVDVSNPSQLKLVGRYRELSGEPFEMYLRDGVAILMFKGWGQYVEADDGDPVYVTTSKIVALDVTDAASIEQLGGFDVPGTISDSRIVGDVLYVAGYENGGCWRCDVNRPTTAVSSLSVADPRAMKKIDELRYADKPGAYSWQRSITVTDKRMYLAGPEYGQNGPIGSTIQVVDISDPAGDLVEGATLQARGEISSRWQMDEWNGVLRVISQQQTWRTNDPPMLQTFKVISSNEFEPLARLNIVIPSQETLRSVRFDGERGYMITALQMDPLFTLDLSDPAAPKQVGELEMPGWIYHMEPRGDRVLGLGYDQGNPEGSITVSLFDVSDLAAPTMISRVNFGGDWGSLPEDQDRIHKVFRVLDDEDLILVPFAGYERSARGADEWYCSGKSIGGVQLVNFANDRLELRGSAPSTGQARRAFLHDEHLFSVSDHRVEAFDIADRSAPKPTSSLIMANTVVHASKLDNDHVVRVTQPAWDGRYLVEVVERANAEDLNRKVGQVSLDSELSGEGEDACRRWWNMQSYHADGNRLYILYNGYRSVRSGAGEQENGVLVIDAEDPTAPKIVGRTRWTTTTDENAWYAYHGGSLYGGYGRSEQYLWHGRTLAFIEQQYNYRGTLESRALRLRVVDLRDAENPSSTTLPLDSAQQYSGLIGDGDRLLTSHFQRATTTSSTRAKFYVDSIDISDPGAPKRLPSVNVPGTLVHFDAASSRAITSELRRVVVNDVTYEECGKRFAVHEFDFSNVRSEVNAMTRSKCVGYVQSLHLVELGTETAALEDTLHLEDSQQLGWVSAGEGRLFATIARGGGYYFGPGLAVDCAGPCGRGYYPGVTKAPPVELLVFGDFGSGAFAVGRLEVETNEDSWYGFWGTPPVYADGTKALLLSYNEAAVVDATDLGDVKVVKTAKIAGSSYAVEITDGTALLALGEQGIQWIEL